MSTNINETLLDEAAEIVSNSDLSDIIDDECDKKDELDPDELEKLRKKYRKEVFLASLDMIESHLLVFNNKEYDVTDSRNELKMSKFLSTLGKDIFNQMKPEAYDNGTRLIRDKEFIKSIRDKKFQRYVSIRRNFNLLKRKLENSESPNKDYMITEIMTITEKLDEYISSYLLTLLIMSSKEQIVEFVNCKLNGK